MTFRSIAVSNDMGGGWRLAVDDPKWASMCHSWHCTLLQFSCYLYSVVSFTWLVSIWM